MRLFQNGDHYQMDNGGTGGTKSNPIHLVMDYKREWVVHYWPYSSTTNIRYSHIQNYMVISKLHSMLYKYLI